MLARLPLPRLVLLISFLTLIVAVMMWVGVPLGGVVGTAAAVVGAGILAVPMAFVVAHGEGGAH